MKKFTKLFLCLLLCVLSVGFVACDHRTDKEKAFTYPTTDDTVSSNGGLCVQKGNYLYFVNGTKSVGDSEHTQNGTYTHGALMLMKLDDSGNIVTDDNEILKDENYIVMSDKLAGFEATSLYIAGDYIYFTTPCQGNTYSTGSSKGEWAKERVTFWRMKLDKTGKPEEIYETEISYENLQFEYFAFGSDVYALVYEDGENLEDSNKSNTLKRVCLSNGAVSEVATGLKDLDYSKNAIYYVVENNSKYELKKYDIKNDTSTLVTSNTNELSIAVVGSENVFISYQSGSVYKLDRYAIADGEFVKTCYTSRDEIPDMIASERGDTLIFVDDNVFKFILPSADALHQVSDLTIEDADATSIDVIGIVNGCVIYSDNDNNIKMVSYANRLADASYEITTITTLEDADTTFDISTDDEYLYFVNTCGSHKYLYRVKVVGNTGDQEELVGLYLDADIPEDEE